MISEVLAARMTKLITARACKNERTARKLANARKDHSIPLVFPVYQVNGVCSSGMCKFEALIFLENVLILKVVVYVVEVTAIRSGNGSFERE